MSDNNKLSNLFADFDNLPKNEWEEIVSRDLNGKDYKKILKWKSTEGFEIEPFFVRDDIEDLPYQKTAPGFPPFTRGGSAEPGWSVCERLFEHEPERANRQIKKYIEQEANSVFLRTEAYPDAGMLGGDLKGLQVQSQSDFDKLFQDIDLTTLVPLFDSGVSSPAILAMFLNHLEKSEFDQGSCKAHFYYDPFTWLAKHGSLPVEEPVIEQAISELAGYSNYKTLSANGLFYHSAGRDDRPGNRHFTGNRQRVSATCSRKRRACIGCRRLISCTNFGRIASLSRDCQTSGAANPLE